MTRKNLSCSSYFHSFMYKYEALPPPINHQLIYRSRALKLRISLNLNVSVTPLNNISTRSILLFPLSQARSFRTLSIKNWSKIDSLKAEHECTHGYTQTQIHGFFDSKCDTQILEYLFPTSISYEYSQVFHDFSYKCCYKLILRSSRILG